MVITEKETQFYQENGYVHVQAVFNSQEVESMRRALEGILQRAAQSAHDHNATWQGDYMDKEALNKLVLKGHHDVHYHDAAFTQAMVHPNMVAILQKLIGPNVQLHHSKMLVKPPEKGAAFPMHQDHPYFPHTKHTMLAASIHLDDATEENGCIHVLPGSHKKGPLPHKGSHYLDPDEYAIEDGVACPAKAGDVLFFNYLTVHGSKPNRSDHIRRNVLYQYRAAEDKPTEEVHVNWGQGLMICGLNPEFRPLRPGEMLKQG